METPLSCFSKIEEGAILKKDNMDCLSFSQIVGKASTIFLVSLNTVAQPIWDNPFQKSGQDSLMFLLFIPEESKFYN